jgi:hypothetical protein
MHHSTSPQALENRRRQAAALAAQEAEKREADPLAYDCDQLNTLWAAAEKQLASLRVPRQCEVLFNEDVNSGGFYFDVLTFTKHNGDWRICFGTKFDPHGAEPAEYRVKPIAECTLDDRVRATEHFSKLRDALVAAKADFLPSLSAAVETLRDALYPMSKNPR